MSTAMRRQRAARETWRVEEHEQARRRRARNVKRIALTSILAGLLLYLLYLSFSPFWHPNTYFVFLTGRDYGTLDVPPADYSYENYAGLTALESSVVTVDPDMGPLNLAVAESPVLLSASVEGALNLGLGRSDVLLIYIDAHGVIENGMPVLLCGDYGLADGQNGRYEVPKLLRQLQRIDAAAKVVFMDTGRIEADPRLGTILDGFTESLRRHVEGLNDDSLWVLTANSPQERSHFSRALQRSVFGYMIARGLTGAADLNEDENVALDELAQYVRSGVTTWVRLDSGGSSSQTPELIWGGGASPPRYPVLLSVSRIPQDVRDQDVSQSIEQAHDPRRRSGLATSMRRVSKAFTETVRMQLERRFANTQITQKLLYHAGAQTDTASAGSTADDATGSGADEVVEPTGADGDDAAEPEQGTERQAPEPGSSATGGQEGESADGTGKAEASGSGGGESSGDERSAPESGNAEGAAEKTPEEREAEAAERAMREAESRIRRKLRQLWTLRDELARRIDGRPTPVDYAPHLWRELQQKLLAHQRRARAGVMIDYESLDAELTDLLRSLRAFRQGRSLGKSRRLNVADRLALARTDVADRLESTRSLAIAEQLARVRGTPLPKNLTALAEALDAAANDSDRGRLSAALDEHGQELVAECFELRLARRIVDDYDLPWSLGGSAIQARRLGERVACHPLGFSPWFRSDIRSADHLRLRAERKMFDRIRPDWRADAESSLAAAIETYTRVSAAQDVLLRTFELRNDLLDRAPYYLLWRSLEGFDRSDHAPRVGDLRTLFEGLSELGSMLRSSDPSSLPRIRQLRAELLDLRSRLEAGMDEDLLEDLVSAPFEAGDGWAAEAMLATPLLSAAARERLLEAATPLHVRLANRIRLPRLPEEVAPRILTATLWKQVDLEMELQWALARLALPADEDAEQTPDGPVPDSRIDDPDARWREHRRTCARLSGFYGELPGRAASLVEALNDRSTETSVDSPADSDLDLRLRALNDALQCMRMVDPRDSMRLDELMLSHRGDEIQWRERLVWHCERLADMIDDAPGAQRDYLLESIRYFRQQQVAVLPGRPEIPRPAEPRVVIQGTTQLPLTTADAGRAAMRLQWQGQGERPAWVMIDYDPQALEIRSPTNLQVYTEHKLEATLLDRRRDAGDRQESDGDTRERIDRLDEAVRYPLRPGPAGMSRSLELLPGREESFELDVRRRSGLVEQTKIVVKVICDDDYVRHEVLVPLGGQSNIRLVADADGDQWSPSAGGIEIHPRPNRAAGYRLALLNTGDAQRTVDVELLAPGGRLDAALPRGELSPQNAEELLRRMEPLVALQRIGELVLPADGSGARLRPPPATEPSVDGAPAVPAVPPASSESEGAEPESGRRLTHGLLLKITDRQTGKVTLRKIEFSPQRPRRYVRAEVGYDRAKERIAVRVVPLNPATVPAEGIPVRCHFREPLPAGTERQLEGEIQSPDFAAEMYAVVPAQAGRVHELWIDVDGYPRAFAFRVPIDRQSLRLPELVDALDVRIERPADFAAFRAPRDSVPVQVRVDAPLGSFPPERNHDFLEVGIDVDRDRDFRGETTVRLASDRQVKIMTTGFGDDGRLMIDTRVGDFQLDVPCGGLRNARVGVMAKIEAGRRVVRSREVEVVLDASAPRFEFLELVPGRTVPRGGELKVSAWYSDENLSEIGKVEIAFDVAGTGEFSAEAPAEQAKHVASGRWDATLKTDTLEPGFNTLLVRATDKVGNESQYHKQRVLIVPAGEASAPAEESKTFRVVGNVIVRDRPLTDADVTLEALKVELPEPPEFSPSRTDDQGRFEFVGLVPGTYTLTAKGLSRNIPYKAEEALVVEVGTERIIRLRLEAKRIQQ